MKDEIWWTIFPKTKICGHCCCDSKWMNGSPIHSGWVRMRFSILAVDITSKNPPRTVYHCRRVSCMISKRNWFDDSRVNRDIAYNPCKLFEISTFRIRKSLPRTWILMKLFLFESDNRFTNTKLFFPIICIEIIFMAIL